MWSSSYNRVRVWEAVVLVEHRIAVTLQHIADQEQRIAQKDISGTSTESSWRLRKTFMAVLQTHQHHREWLLDHLH